MYWTGSSRICFFGDGQQVSDGSSNGKFQIEIRDKVVIIMNTQNGDYLVAPDMIDLQRNKWIKGEFYKSFKTAKDQNKE